MLMNNRDESNKLVRAEYEKNNFKTITNSISNSSYFSISS